MILKRGAYTAPAFGRETVAVPELGGEVVVVSMGLAERGIVLGAASTREVYANMAYVLSRCVRDDDDNQFLDEDGWEGFAADHFTAALNLFIAIRRVSLLNREDLEKKLESTPN